VRGSLALVFVTALAFAAPALGQAAQRPVHTFAQVALAPDGSAVADVESVEPAPDATARPVATLIVRALKGHGITDPADQRDISRRILAWFDRYLT
jgi:hypothetical protein